MKEKAMKHHVYSVGDEVYVVTYSSINGIKGEPMQGEVTKVGRKYFYVKFDWHTERFYIKNNRHDGRGYSARYFLFPSMQAFQEYTSHGKLLRKLQRAFEYRNIIDADLEQLRQIAKILGIKEDGDEN